MTFVRISMTIDPQDLALIDRLAAVEGLNRSAEVRSLFLQLRPVLVSTLDAVERARAARSEVDRVAVSVVAEKLQLIQEEAEKLSDQVVGVLAELGGPVDVA